MTDISGGEFVGRGSFTIASVKPPPQYLTIGSFVRISLDDGSIEYGDGYQPAEAARTFWEAMSKAYGDALAAVERIRALHIPARGGRSGYQPDDDDTPGTYGHIASACEECGSQDLAVRWPCPTIQALEQQ